MPQPSEREIEVFMGLSERTVKNYWNHARAWLFREIKANRKSG